MDIFPPPHQQLNPFPFYAQMRKLHPIEYDDKNKMWGIFRYNDIQNIFADYRHFSSDILKLVNIQQEQLAQQGQQQELGKERASVRRSILTSDPPYHAKLRSVISSAFTSNTIWKLKPRIEEICHGLIDKVIEQGNMDLINELAYPLPVTVIAELLGIPADDQDIFRRWADELLGSTRGSSNNLPIDTKSEQIFKKVQDEMDSYFSKIIEKRREKMISANDLISNLLKAEIDGNRLAEEEILAFCALLLLAGHVTTVNLIGNIVRSLLEYPQQLEQLYCNVKDSSYNSPSVQSAIDETLRYRSPVQALFRFAMEDVVIGGHKVQAGQRIILWIGSANHDESVFPDAEGFDITRTITNNTHLAFGHGIHFCLGSTLANLEAQVVLKIILDRLKDVRFAVDYKVESLRPLHGMFFHGVNHLPISFKPARLKVAS